MFPYNNISLKGLTAMLESLEFWYENKMKRTNRLDLEVVDKIIKDYQKEKNKIELAIEGIQGTQGTERTEGTGGTERTDPII